MRLAVSNLAWPAAADAAAARLLDEHQVRGVEIAPTKVWPRPLEATFTELAAFRRDWERRGMQIIALQALLFEKPEYRVFGSPAQRQECLDYLRAMIRLAAQLGATVLVFGSPKNRAVADLPGAAAWDIAVEFFRRLGEHALDNEVCFCIEPNPIEYGCDFVTTVADAVALVETVNHPGFGLHLDAGGMHLAGDPPRESFALATTCWRHFHISEPFLAPTGAGGMPHAAFGAALTAAGYDRWLSIEMKYPGEHWASVLRQAISYARSSYSVALGQALSVLAGA